MLRSERKNGELGIGEQKNGEKPGILEKDFNDGMEKLFTCREQTLSDEYQRAGLSLWIIDFAFTTAQLDQLSDDQGNEIRKFLIGKIYDLEKSIVDELEQRGPEHVKKAVLISPFGLYIKFVDAQQAKARAKDFNDLISKFGLAITITQNTWKESAVIILTQSKDPIPMERAVNYPIAMKDAEEWLDNSYKEYLIKFANSIQLYLESHHYFGD